MVHLGNPMPNDMKSNICVGEVISSLPNTRLEDVPLMEFMYLALTCMPGESYCR